MNMKKWTTPMAMEESFTANVDVAVTTCYKVACNAPAANAYEKEHRQGLLGWYCPDHTDYYCTDSTKNVIKVDSNTIKLLVWKENTNMMFSVNLPLLIINKLLIRVI